MKPKSMSISQLYIYIHIYVISVWGKMVPVDIKTLTPFRNIQEGNCVKTGFMKPFNEK